MGKNKRKSKAASSRNVKKGVAEVDILKTEAILAAAINSANQPVRLKTCRLCEAKDGPFLNIFGTDNSIAKKIDDLLPFVIREDDDLPHKICFRCSAKVVELHDFVQKCVKSQQNFQKEFGKSDTYLPKTNTRKIWEETLNKSNMSNDDICDAVIKRAMEGIVGVQPLPLEEIPKETKEVKKPDKPQMKDAETETDREPEKPSEKISDISITSAKILSEKVQKNDRINKKASTSNSMPSEHVVSPSLNNTVTRQAVKKQEHKKHIEPKESKLIELNKEAKNDEQIKKTTLIKSTVVTTDFKLDENISVEEKRAFDIMAHVSIIKVNGVGTLFQCTLCNRNFLKKDVVLSHSCAKTGIPKVDFTKSIAPVEPPKNPQSNVKYIKQIPEIQNPTKINVQIKPKPKVGPASRVKHYNESEHLSSKVSVTNAPKNIPSIQKLNHETIISTDLPNAVTGMKNQYKLLPGPNNTYTLVEHGTDTNHKPTPSPVVIKRVVKPEEKHTQNFNSKNKFKELEPLLEQKVKHTDTRQKINDFFEKTVPNVEEHGPQLMAMPYRCPVDQPYPVGLFQTIPRNTEPAPHVKAGFTTVAMKKQSYTIVQTGNPSKLLISAKRQAPDIPEAPVMGKTSKKRKHQEVALTEQKQPTAASSESTSHSNGNQNFFTFINVDPLMQPSYVLPTDNIIQESQITTSTPVTTSTPAAMNSSKNAAKPYVCNICNDSFNREKKLLAHIQSHLNELDDVKTNMRKRLRK